MQNTQEMKPDEDTAEAINLPGLEDVFSTTEEAVEFFQKFGENGRTFRDFTELSPESMEAFYMMAYNFYSSGKYEDAAKVFQLLCMLNHFEVKYWKGLGASRENLKDYDGALQAYGYLTMIDLHDPYPPFYGAKCLLALDRVDEAEAGLRAAIFNSEGKKEAAEMHQQASHLLSMLEKRKTRESAS